MPQNRTMATRGRATARPTRQLLLVIGSLFGKTYYTIAFQVGCSTFASSTIKPRTVERTTDTRERTNSCTTLAATSSPQPYTVSVCTAELCCCQEEGPGGNEILEHLLSRDLPYSIGEAPCLGACGGGAMVSIDFEDGSYALAAGLDETLSELSLSEMNWNLEITTKKKISSSK